MIRFLLNQEMIEISHCDSNQTVLEWLRQEKRLTGTKEGCASGDCGACTVTLAEVNSNQDGLAYKSINSCITFLSSLDGKQLITVEHLAENDFLHPVQQAMVDEHGSQCGFCTPGFVMSMFALYKHRQKNPQGTLSKNEVSYALSGNLCRCTGYRPIIDATILACNNPKEDHFNRNEKEVASRLSQLETGLGTEGLHIPRSRADLAKLIATYPDYRLFSGSTDLALEVTQQHKYLPNLINLTFLPELQILQEQEDALHIGAAVSYERLSPMLLKHYPEAAELLERLGSLPIRNQGTMGGNIANASPIGDCPPLLLALKAKLVLDNGTKRREIAIDDFFTGYRETLMNANEWLEKIIIPIRSEHTMMGAYKISKRFEDDISAVCAVFCVTVENDKISSIRSGFGGVAATPMRAAQLEESLLGKTWNADVIAIGQEILQQAFDPIDDVRATATYRKSSLMNLWKRFVMENQALTKSIPLRVWSHA